MMNKLLSSLNFFLRSIPKIRSNKLQIIATKIRFKSRSIFSPYSSPERLEISRKISPSIRSYKTTVNDVNDPYNESNFGISCQFAIKLYELRLGTNKHINH